jgi:hypothetical protein
MLRTVLAVAASTLIVFVWGALSWSVLPWHQPLDFKDADAVAKVIKENAPEHGTYALPSWKHEEGRTQEIMMKEREEGPFLWATVRPGKSDVLSMSGAMFQQLLVVILASITMVFLIQKSRHDAFLDRLSMAVLAGLLLSIMGALPSRIYLESTQTLAYFIDGILPWSLAGAAIAAILPKRKPA